MVKIFYIVWCFLCVISLQAEAQKGKYFEKSVRFPEKATLEEKVDMAARLIPSKKQLAWQQLELTAFIHFGMNTFTGKERGDGKEFPVMFNPVALDAEQWVKALKAGGFKLVILTAKHHDGFCLWPTKTTRHSVAASPWKNGKGDIVRELRKACDRHGMKFGLYVSPWDLNAVSYGDSVKYNDFFVRQLTELLTDYGKVDEVWLDGAGGNGENGKRQGYNWDLILSTINKLQPNAVTSICGDDVRWIGNESGRGREMEWSSVALVPRCYPNAGERNTEMRLNVFSRDLGGRDVIRRASELFWYPSEVDVSIRPGWFYHEKEDAEVKSLAELVKIYFQSVGCNSSLLLNVPPDKRGLINEKDVARLKEFGDYLTKMYAIDLVSKSFRPWTAKEGESKEYTLGKGCVVNTILLQEDVSRGQRVEAFTVEGLVNGGWQVLGKGGTIGYKRLLRIPDTSVESIRVTINNCRKEANVSRVGVFLAPEIPRR